MFAGVPQALQEADAGMTEGEWQGALHWKTWVLAGLDVCISTIKCAAAAAPPYRRPISLPEY